MSKSGMVSVTLPSGEHINVAECKKNKIEKYMIAFRSLPSIEQAILFGSALTSECSDTSDIDICLLYSGNKRDFREEQYYLYSELMPEATGDDIITIRKEEYHVLQPFCYDVMSDVKTKGKLIYDKAWSD